MKSIITKNNITIAVNGKTYTAHSTHANFNKIKALLKKRKHEGITKFFDVVSAVKDFGVDVVNGVVYWNKKPLHNVITQRILGMVNEGQDNKPLIKFLNNLMENPSQESVDDLYRFLEYNNLPITSDGCFLGYRRVNKDFKDYRTNSFDNSVGQVVSMPRSQVDQDKNNTCSFGLHLCSRAYLGHFNDGDDESHIVLCKVNPKNVCAVPTDYQNTKMRVCEFEVLQEISKSNLDNPKANGLDKTVLTIRRSKDGRFLPKNAPYRNAKGHFVKKPVEALV